MKQVFDLLIVVIIVSLFAFIMLFITIAIKVTSKGSVLYWSDRVGQNNRIFKIVDM